MNQKTKIHFISKALKVHNDTYGYDKVVYTKATEKVIITCKIHGDFLQSPAAHIAGQRCPICAKDSQIKLISNTQEEFISKSCKVHNNVYDYSLVDYKNGMSKVIIICKKHGEFIQTAKLHMQGYGCPNCHRSKGEELITRLLDDNKIKYETQKTFDNCIGLKNKLPFDFYLSDYNLLIEYDGVQHFRPTFGEERFEMTKRNDNTKTHYATHNNLPFLRITYKEKIFEKLSKFLASFNIKLNPLSY